ncbi:MAG: V-type ATP synthase subunit E family protein [Methanocellales archaeon]|nr:V-type ATP synthase subunit E family protein [Methanocellales archaeon]
MDGIDKIISKIESDAKAEMQRIKADAMQEAKKILDDARRRGEQEHSRILERGRKDIDALVNRIKSGARIDAMRTVIGAKDQVISRCFTEAREALSKLTATKKYETVLRNLMTDGAKLVGNDVIILSNKKDKSVVKKVISSMSKKGAKISVGKKDIDTIGGVAIKSKSGDIMVNNTFEARLERQKNELRYEISRILYGEK